MLPPLDASWRLVASRTRGAQAHLHAMIARFPHVPSEYLEIARDLQEYELKHQTGQYFRIWPPSACIEMDDAHEISRRIPQSIPIGDDGGDRVILYLSGDEGFGLYRVGFGSLDKDDARFIAPSLKDILSKSVGVLPDDIW